MSADAAGDYDVVILGGGSAATPAPSGGRAGALGRARREGQAGRHLPAPGLHPDQGAAARRRGRRRRPRGRAVRRAHDARAASTCPASTPTRTASSAASTRVCRAWSSRRRSTYVEGCGPARRTAPPSTSADRRLTGPQRRARHGQLREDAARSRDRRPHHDERAGPLHRPRARPCRRARRRCHRRRVRLRLQSFGSEVTIVEALPRLVAAEDEADQQGSWSARSASARSPSRPASRFAGATQQGDVVTVSLEYGTRRSRPTCCSWPSGAGP